MTKLLEISLVQTDWWDSLSRKEQIDYLKDHKDSKFKGKVKKPYEDQTKSESDRKAFKQAADDGVAIPPAWSNVEYYGIEGKNGIRAIGRNEQGRLVRLEVPEHREAKIVEKHEKIKNELAPKMKKITSTLRKQAKEGDEESKVLYLITQTAFRIGDRPGISVVDGETQSTYGASSLLVDHVSVEGNSTTFDFLGKGGIRQHHVIKNPVIAEFIKEKIDSKESGQRLFDTNAKRIRDKWRSVGGDKVHDTRSFIATEIAKQVIEREPTPTNEKEMKALIKKASEAAAAKLGNKPAESLKTYIDQTIFEGLYNAGE